MSRNPFCPSGLAWQAPALQPALLRTGRTSRTKLGGSFGAAGFADARSAGASLPSLFQAKSRPSCEPAKTRSPFALAAIAVERDVRAASNFRSFADVERLRRHCAPGARCSARPSPASVAAKIVGPAGDHASGVTAAAVSAERIDALLRLHVPQLELLIRAAADELRAASGSKATASTCAT